MCWSKRTAGSDWLAAIAPSDWMGSCKNKYTNQVLQPNSRNVAIAIEMDCLILNLCYLNLVFIMDWIVMCLDLPGRQGETSADLDQLRGVKDLPDFEEDVDRAPEIGHLVLEETPLKWEDPSQDVDHTLHIQPQFCQTLAVLAKIFIQIWSLMQYT